MLCAFLWHKMATSRSLILARAFSTSPAGRQLVKAPTQVFGLEGRYATALYSAASKEKKLDVIEKELTDFQKQIKSDAKVREFLINPTLKREIKKEALKAVSAALKLSNLSGNLLGLLAENGRLKKLDGVISSFRTLMAAHRGEVVCEVTTAKALDEASKKELETALKMFMKKGETLLLTTHVNPELLGGMVVSIGDKYVDMSTASKIKRYTDLLNVAV